MAKFDMEAVIRTMVAEEVERSLEPYRDLLAGMAKLAGGEAPRRRPGRPAAVRAEAAPAARRGPGRPRKSAGTDASKFTVGQAVRYKQGRGEFDASIVRIDPETNVVTLERSKDKKQVERPADKIYAAP
jgi:sRNA-binding protein